MFCVKCTFVAHLLFYRCCHFVSHFGSWISLNDSWCPTCDITRGQWLQRGKVSNHFVLLMHCAVVEQADWNWPGNYFCYVFTSYSFLLLLYVICTFSPPPPLHNWAALLLNIDLSYRFIFLMTQFQILSCHLCKYMKTTLCESDITYTEDFLLY